MTRPFQKMSSILIQVESRNFFWSKLMPPLNSLTPEQKAQIPRYREKWRSLLFSTKRIERSRARGFDLRKLLMKELAQSQKSWLIIDDNQEVYLFKNAAYLESNSGYFSRYSRSRHLPLRKVPAATVGQKLSSFWLKLPNFSVSKFFFSYFITINKHRKLR